MLRCAWDVPSKQRRPDVRSFVDNPSDYLLDLAVSHGEAGWDRLAVDLYRRVFRTDLSHSGFAVLNLPPGTDSHELRRTMMHLKRTLAERFGADSGRRLAFHSLGRFNQQHTTKPHRDNAPNESVLMLGYEPTPVLSRFFVADYTACAADLGLSPDEFLATHNPMYAAGQDLLTPYTTELIEICGQRPQIVLVNNSSRPADADPPGLLGMLHHAVIPQPDRAQQRIVNSTMLVALDSSDDEPLSAVDEEAFVATERISESAYA